MSATLVLALIQAASVYGPAIVDNLMSLVKDRDDKTDAEVLAELDALVEATKASDARIQAHVHKP